MKQGQSLTEIAQQLTEQLKTKRDFVAPTSQLIMDPTANLGITGIGKFELTDLAHEQMAARVGIPQKYYDRMLTASPELLAQNVNHWFHKEPESRMIRTMGNKARAILSKRFRPLDNYDLAEAVLPIVEKMGCRIESSALTEGHLYLKMVTAKVEAKVKGDVVQAGIVISNSEVGLGSVKVEPMIWTLACLNGMIAADYSLHKYHVGRAGGNEMLAEEFFRDETRKADDKAFWLKVRDVVQGALQQDVFNKIVGRLKDATKDPIDGPVEKVMEKVQEHFALSEDERGGILQHLIKGGDLTRYGLLNAVTRASQDVAEYERATEMEKFGGQILELPKREWASLVEVK